MTSPRKKKTAKPDVFNTTSVERANWLGRYLPIEAKAVVAINAALEDAERSITKSLESLDKDNISTGIRRAQLNLNLQTVRKTLTQVFGQVTNIIRDHQAEAAVAAVDAGFFDDRFIMEKIFPDVVDRQNFTNSFRRTAERNTQAMMTRILKTQQPLSRRVWKTKALAQGYIDRAVNNALAKGDSYKNLAKSVSHLVNPATPGGVSYAAKRLARTEINNAFHAQSISDMEEKPWVDEVEWHLSKRHLDDPGDLCEEYADFRYFAKWSVPEKPHPNCRCFVTAKLMDYDEFEDRLVAGDFDEFVDKYYVPEGSQKPKAPPTPADRTLEQCVRASQVAEYINKKHPEIAVEGFDDKADLNVESLREIARSIDDVKKRHPEALLRRIDLQDKYWFDFALGQEDAYAATTPLTSDPYGTIAGSEISFNTKYLTNKATEDRRLFLKTGQRFWTGPERAKKAMSDDVQSGWHPKNSEKRPIYSTMIHELGHVLDNSGARRMDYEAPRILLDTYAKLLQEDKIPFYDIDTKMNITTPGAKKLGPNRYRVPQGFTYWLDDQISNYGKANRATHVARQKNLDSPEAIAEAFGDYWINGENASEASKALSKKLVAYAQAPNPDWQIDYAVDMKKQFFNLPSSLDVSSPLTNLSAPVQDQTYAPVKWTGPKVVEPSEDALWEVQSTWQDIGFDATKDDMRLGAHQAQEEGYDGIPNGLSGWRLQRFLRSREGHKIIGKELVAQAVHSDPTIQRCWRGMIVEKRYIDQMESGGRLSLPLSSFSENYRMGRAFAIPSELGGMWKSDDVPDNGIGVVFQLEPGARVASLPLRECVAFGQFEIVDLKKSKGIFEVTIRQTSMIEEIPAREADSATLEIPEITILAKPGDAQGFLDSLTPLKSFIDEMTTVREIEQYISNFTMSESSLGNADIESARQIGHALEDMFDKFPGVHIDKFSVKDLGDPSVFGQCYPVRARRFQGAVSNIEVNDFWAENNDSYRSRKLTSIEKGIHPKGFEKSPAYSTVVHEFGHSIVNAIGVNTITKKNIQDALIKGYNKSDTELDINDWIATLPGYCFYDYMLKLNTKRDINLDEALAEAFAEVEINGSRASEPAQAIHKMLVDKYEKAYGGY